MAEGSAAHHNVGRPPPARHQTEVPTLVICAVMEGNGAGCHVSSESQDEFGILRGSPAEVPCRERAPKEKLAELAQLPREGN